MESKAIQAGQHRLPPAIDYETWDRLVGLIYEGPMESIPWQAALEEIRLLFSANHALLILRPTSAQERGLTIRASGGQPIVTPSDYYDYGYALDPFVGLAESRITTVDDLIGAEHWTSSEFFLQFVQPADIRYIMGANFRTRGGVDCRFRVCRPLSAGKFTDEDMALAQLTLPHFNRAVHLHTRLDLLTSERELYSSTVDRMMVGTLLFDETLTLLRVNSVAQDMLAEKDGLELRQGGLVATYLSAENQELQRLIAKALAPSPAGAAPRLTEAVALTRPSGRSKLGVVVNAIPLNEWSEGRHRPAVVVYLRDPDRKSDASTAVLRRLFDFTPAEAELALLLSSGKTLDEAAEVLGIRKNTVRAQLRSIFSKTGVTRQTALVHVLLNSVMTLN
ncbi:helix-turn-helix transcriptional regulator [Pseudoduganella namucuonensis]|uniref:DNA-binding transcriptional regulator, CsgD family n=1 Tax=Pseudoduganella namucuonensis TaxID=1035707 RepID=A0A1I7M5Q8_9BURK|nr:helix-turn-helix transcriptional regulator [Pseudoduganella namucuonensis]SFV17278.1 DNA-binding transcriptional regulator, CsgD family [Pseudoduganella namucuonensis]